MLPESFYADKKVEELANALLGCELVHETEEGKTAGIIVETESYHETDEASHSYRGKSKRTAVMFGPPGHAYIYFTYGMHYCFNIVAENEGVGAGVLIRALEPTQGIELMKKRRNQENIHNLCNGPAKLVQAMGISKEDYGKPLYEGGLYVTEPKLKNIKIAFGPRIGISKAQEKPWRFWIEDSLFVSNLRR
ncbi:MAG TPA: DNA-3-methyladenine glycosylase [Candidatus Saccharimonadales bacterium]|nr:DNA-3-methyladenine glycosylase [Candidatus Saccharimonadales bacterium]